jgi:hypothetical protein
VSGATRSALVDDSGRDTGYRLAPTAATIEITFVYH